MVILKEYFDTIKRKKEVKRFGFSRTTVSELDTILLMYGVEVKHLYKTSLAASPPYIILYIMYKIFYGIKREIQYQGQVIEQRSLHVEFQLNHKYRR
jgi:hypothetical protein